MKPFTSKHCMQYLTKESPLYQGLKQLHNRPVQQKPMERKPDVEPMNLPELATPKLKEQYRKKTGPTGIAPEKQKYDDSEKGRKERLKREQKAGKRDKYGYQTSSYEK